MKQILVIAWREITRLRKRFGGGASPIAVVALLAVLGLSAYTMRDTVTLGSGLYRIGVAGEVPPIQDSRFAVQEVSAEQGKTMLDQYILDVLIVDDQVFSRTDDKSQYAIRALKQYLETQELIRVGNSYPQGEAFPLRVGINYLAPSQLLGQGEAEGDALADVTDTQGIQKPVQRRLFAFFQRFDEVLCGLLTHALQSGQRFHIEHIQTRHIINQAVVHQLFHQLVTQALDIHGTP